MLLLQGTSCVGKTRTLHHAIERVLPDWPMLSPVDATALHATLEQGVPAGSVLWLDELEIYLEEAEYGPANAGYLTALFTDHRTPGFLVAATIWPNTLTKLTTGDDATSTVIRRLLERHSALIAVPTALTDDADPQSLTTAADSDPRIRRAFETSATTHQVTQTLAGGVLLIGRYDGRTATRAPAYTPAAKAVITAAMDLRRVGYPNPLPKWAIEGAAPGYLPAKHNATVSRAWITDGLGEASEETLGVRALTPHAATPGIVDAYHLHDYLHHDHQTRRRYTPTTQALWDTLTANAPDIEVAVLFGLTGSAQARGMHSVVTAFDRASPRLDPPPADVGEPTGQPDVLDDKPAPSSPTFRPAISILLSSSDRQRADALYRAGDLDGLIEVAGGYRPRDGYVARRLASLLVDQGRISELREMATHSHAAAQHLADFIANSSGELAFQELIELSYGNARAAERLAEKYLQRGDLDRAFDVAARSGPAQYRLVQALGEEGDVSRLQRAVHAEFAPAATRLLALLQAEHPGGEGELDVFAKWRTVLI
jgi:hypothetical protein